MVLVHMSGGFGNQMFSYAFGYAMAKKRDEKLVIDTAIQDAAWFFRNPDILEMRIKYDERITYPINRTILDRAILNKIRFRNAIGWNTKIIRENLEIEDSLLTYLDLAKSYENVYFKGDWAALCYFEEYVNDIVKMFVFKKNLSDYGRELQKEINQNRNSVALHYRRGDYVKLGASPEPEYFINAMKYMAAKLEKPVFYCFSEDLPWVGEKFHDLPWKIKYIDYKTEKKDLEDFRLIQSAQHQIISNSTYSWWAAFLNKNPDKIVVAPVGKIWGENFYPQTWIKLPFGKE